MRRWLARKYLKTAIGKTKREETKSNRLVVYEWDKVYREIRSPGDSYTDAGPFEP